MDIDEDQIGDINAWTSDDISRLWAELDRLRSIAKADGWEDEFLDNVREWVDTGGGFPIKWLKLRKAKWPQRI